MKYNRQKLAAFIVLFSIILVSNASNPPNGKTGAPGENTCAQSGCHSGGNANLDGEIVLSGIPTDIIAGATYQITVTVDNPNGVANRAGFQWVALDGSNNNAGTISNPSANSTTAMLSGKRYHEHSQAPTFGASNVLSWTADWTAPAGPSGEVITFYGVGNIANGSTANGDRIRNTTVSGTLSESAVNLTATITESTDVTCAFGSNGSATVLATGGTPPYTYLWNDGQDTPMATGFIYGTKYVTVTDAVFDTAIDSVMLGQPTFLNGQIDTLIDATCGLDNGRLVATTTGGNPPYEYIWSDGQNGPIAVGLTPGQYFCTVSDASMCETQFGGFVNHVGDIIGIQELNLELIACSNSTVGALIEVAGIDGVAPYEYIWSNNSMDSIIQNIGSGLYEVTVSDANGCTASAEYLIEIPSPFVLEMSNVNQVSCFGGMDGSSVPVTLGGTAPPATYLWSDGSTNDTLQNVMAGTYSLTVTSTAGCVAVDSVTITEPSELVSSIGSEVDDSSLAPDGTAFVNASGGAGGYNIVWQNGAITDTIKNLFTGVYFVTITDANNCSIVDSVMVSPDNCMLEAIPNVLDISCADLDDGSISLTFNNSFDPLIYTWSTGATTNTITDLTEGLYSVTVSDRIFCIDTLTGLEIINPDTLRLMNDIVQLPVCESDSTTLLSAFITGGTAPFSASWSNGTVADTLSMIPAGQYTATITDHRGCLDSLSFDIAFTDNEAPVANFVDTVFLYLDANGLTDSLKFADFDLGSSDACGLAEITFASTDYDCTDLNITYEVSVSLEDSTGLSTQEMVHVTILDTLAPTITCPMDFTMTNCGFMQHIDPVAEDNCTADIVLISGPAQGTYPTAGMHTIVYEATDDSGNSNRCSFTVTVDTIVALNLEVTDVSCFGLADGCFTFDISGGVAPYDTLFEDPSIVSCTNLAAGSYPFTVMDSDNCTVHDTLVVNQPDALVIEAGALLTNSTTSNSMDGAIDITISGGTPSYMVEWFLNGISYANTEDLTGLAPGSYTCVITDANTCSLSSEDFEITAITSVNDLAFAEWITMQPNPASDRVFISLDYQDKLISQISILDMTGALILTQEVNATQYKIDLENIPSSVYMIKIQVGNESVTKRLIVR